jgi:NADH:ubiquinone oxidoreductase subunit K
MWRCVASNGVEMSLFAVTVAQEVHDRAPMVMDIIWFPIIAAAAFVTLGLVTYSFRDVANRHSHKTGGAAPHGTDHH